MKTKTKTNMKLLASSLLICAALTAGCKSANKKSTTQQASGIPPMNMAALNVPTAPVAAATPPPPAVAMTPPAAAQPVVYDPPAAEAADSVEPVADASDSVAPVRRSRPAPAPARPAARKASASSANATKARYTIRKGDSLWSIAEAKYGDGNKWKRIAAANPKLNPNRVQAGQTITLP